MEIKLDYLFCLLISAVVSIVLHEMAHGFAALWQGDDTAKASGRLSLNPIKHIDPFTTILLPLVLAAMGAPIFGGAKPVPVNTVRLKHGIYSMALVALAGPLMNFVLAGIVCLIGCWTGVAEIREGLLYTIRDSFIGTFVGAFVTINIGLGLFNLLPIPPLDGSRVFYCIMPDAIRDLMDTLEQRGGRFVVYVFICICGTLISAYTVAGSKLFLKFLSLFI